MQYQIPKGMRDVTPKESYKWQYIEGLIRKLCATYGFHETRTPVLEHTELFLRSVGDTTDVVQKEMYTFTDKGDRSVTLKPEGTAGVARMFMEAKLFNEAQPTKLYYLCSAMKSRRQAACASITSLAWRFMARRAQAWMRSASHLRSTCSARSALEGFPST